SPPGGGGRGRALVELLVPGRLPHHVGRVHVEDGRAAVRHVPREQRGRDEREARDHERRPRKPAPAARGREDGERREQGEERRPLREPRGAEERAGREVRERGALRRRRGGGRGRRRREARGEQRFGGDSARLVVHLEEEQQDREEGERAPVDARRR